jgi:hypothetical protein
MLLVDIPVGPAANTSQLWEFKKVSGNSTSDCCVAVGNEFNGVIAVFAAHEELRDRRFGRACHSRRERGAPLFSPHPLLPLIVCAHRPRGARPYSRTPC